MSNSNKLTVDDTNFWAQKVQELPSCSAHKDILLFSYWIPADHI